MNKVIKIQTLPEIAANTEQLRSIIARELNVKESTITHFEIQKRSIDARQKQVKINLELKVFVLETFVPQIQLPIEYQDVTFGREVVIIGAGPAGLFAALKLIENGIKPIILERGKKVNERRRDLAIITREHIVNPDSNYCFGEGGAGTYSDGKLYTRSKKRGDVEKVLRVFIEHGANPDILVNAHPHIGTDKLPNIIKNIREKIISCGGQILFNSRVTDLKIKDNKICGVKLQNENEIAANQVILATGHSARDIFEMLYSKNINIGVKPFSLGVRIEHPQHIIDQIQYKCLDRGEFLPPASYRLVKQIKQRGVYSFCMCPGGVIAPCATQQNEVVTNGWSPSKRNQPTSNSGIVVVLRSSDFSSFEKFGPLAGMKFQQQIEQLAWNLAGRTQKVPAQILTDFLNKKASAHIPKTSYLPGVTSVEMDAFLPSFIVESLREGFRLFNKGMPGFITSDAVIHAPESRTSSPVKIPRDPQSMQHPQVAGLYPCGEGAGYAGGIVSAAIDGEKCAEKC